MNSRQRRKSDAIKHNIMLDEKKAYTEDLRRDPEKYKKAKSSSLSNRARLSVIMASSIVED